MSAAREQESVPEIATEGAFSARLLIGVVVGTAIGVSSTDSAPLLLGVYVDDLGFSERNAALVTSVELAMAALAAMLAAGRVAHGSRPRYALAGTAIVILGQLLSLGVPTFPALVAVRAVAGLGAGIALASATAAAAGARDPDRLFATVMLFGGLLGAVYLGSLGVVIGLAGASGAFLLIAGLCALGVPMLGWLPASRAASGDAPRERAPHAGRASMVLSAVFLTALGQGVVWSFNDRIGQAAGLSVDQVGLVLGAATLLGLGGALLAVWLGTRTGRAVPILGAQVFTVSCALLITTATDPVTFAVGDVAWSFGFFFLLPYMMGTLASLDPLGRWAAISTGMSAIGMALGPAIAGLLVTPGSYGGLGVLVLGCGVAAFALLAPVLIGIDRRG